MDTVIFLPLLEEALLRARHLVVCGCCLLLAAAALLPAAFGALRHLRAGARRFRAWAARVSKTAVLAALLAVAHAVYVGGSKPEPPEPPPQGRAPAPSAQGAPQPAAEPRPAFLMPPPAGGFTPPPRHTNRLTRAQYDACFALTHVATNASHDFAPPAGAEVTDHAPAAHGVHDDAWWAPLPSGFNAGGLEDRSRRVTAVCAAPSGMLLLDGLPGRPAPAAPVFPDLSSNRVLSVLQTPSGLLPPEGRLWSAAGTGGWHHVTWNGLMLGRREEAAADLQCRLHQDGDFEYFIRARPGSDLSAVTNWLIGARDAGGGEAFAFADDAPLSDLLPSGGAALALRWTAFGRLDPAVPDTDGDGLTDWEELMIHRTDPRRWDTDGDGLADGEEALEYGTGPLSPDSLGDGTNDFWRAVDASRLASAPSPWMDGGAGLALLTLETRLEAPAGLAALRVGDVVVPVRPGTAEVSRVAFPLGANVPFALVSAPGPEAAPASVTALDADAPVVFDDPGGVFALPPAPAGRGLRPAGAPPPPRAATGVLHGVKYGFNPAHLCPHTGLGTLKVSVIGGYPRNSGVAGVGFVTGEGGLAGEICVAEWQVAAAAQAQGKTAPGPHTVDYPVAVGVAAEIGRKILKPVAANSIPAHHCVFESDGGGAHPPEGACPCCTNQVCPCRCESPGACGCRTCRDPYAVNAPANSAGQPLATQSRRHRLLLAGGAADGVAAAPQSPDGSSANGRCVYCQCHQYSPAQRSLPARVWRLTSGLSVSPAGLATSGVFTVTGRAPSAEAGGDVFTWNAGPVYSRGRYTVAGLGVCFSNAPAGAAPRVQPGHTNILVVTARVPADGGGTLSFSGHADAALAEVRNLQTGGCEPLRDSYAASEWLAKYAAAETRAAEVRHAAGPAGRGLFTVTYGLPGADPASVSTNLAFEAVRTVAEPVSAATGADGRVYNPSGMPVGGTARFKIEVLEGAVPDADITWTIKEGAGRVAFAGGNTGPEVAVTATATGSFRLEADIKGLVITPPHVRPYFTGAVLPAVNVPVSVWIVKDAQSNPIRPLSTIPDLLADANKILWQRGLTLVQSGPCHLLNNTNWLHHTDVLNPANTNLAAMLDTTNSMGNVVEVYFVDTLNGETTAGLRHPKGVAIAAIGDGHTIAHEVLHDCGPEDIYTVENPGGPDPNPVSGPVSEERIPADWGGGYYPPGLTQRSLITRLLMRGERFGPEPSFSGSICLPRGTVYGWRNTGSGTVRTLGNAGVGQSAVQRNPGSYQEVTHDITHTQAM